MLGEVLAVKMETLSPQGELDTMSPPYLLSTLFLISASLGFHYSTHHSRVT